MSGLTSRWSFMNWFRSGSDEQDESSREEGSSASEGRARADVAVREPANRRDQALEQLQGAYQEVVGLMNSIQGHMSAQSDRSERLLKMMEGLPEALRTLPESQRNQARMLEAIQGHLAQQTENTQGLTQAIQGLAQAADNHERSMSVIQQRLDASEESSRHVMTSFNALSETLGRMSESSQAGTQVLERLAERGEQADTQMRDLFGRNQRQMTALSMVSWALAITALSVASIVAVWVGQEIAGGDAVVAADRTQAADASPSDGAALPDPATVDGAAAEPTTPTAERASSTVNAANGLSDEAMAKLFPGLLSLQLEVDQNDRWPGLTRPEVGEGGKRPAAQTPEAR